MPGVMLVMFCAPFLLHVFVIPARNHTYNINPPLGPITYSIVQKPLVIYGLRTISVYSLGRDPFALLIVRHILMQAVAKWFFGITIYIYIGI